MDVTASIIEKPEIAIRRSRHVGLRKIINKAAVPARP